LAARIEGVTSSSKGLLPQLVDLLYALADSQELLTRRIRRAQQELLGVHSSDVDGLRPTLILDQPRPCAPFLIGTSQAPATERFQSYSVDTGNSTTGPSEPCEATSTSQVCAENAPLTPTQPDSTTPLNAVDGDATSTTDLHLHEKVMSRRPDGFAATRRDATRIDPGNPTYNFFDELDVRLADLRSSENGSDTN
jgi:hypothetical protein